MCGHHHDGISVTNDHEYVQFVVVTIRSFPHSCLVTGSWSESYTTGVTVGVGTVYPTGAPLLYWVRVAKTLAFCVVHCLSFLFWQLHCLSFDLWLLIIPLVFPNSFVREQIRFAQLSRKDVDITDKERQFSGSSCILLYVGIGTIKW
jgi:hypothetical protein